MAVDNVLKDNCPAYKALIFAFNDLKMRYNKVNEENATLKLVMKNSPQKVPPPRPLFKPKLPPVSSPPINVNQNSLEHVVSTITDQITIIGLQFQTLMDDLEGDERRMKERGEAEGVVQKLAQIEEVVSDYMLPQLQRLNSCKASLINTTPTKQSFKNEIHDNNNSDDIVNLQDLQKLLQLMKEQNSMLRKAEWHMRGGAVVVGGESLPSVFPSGVPNFRNTDDLTTLTQEEWTFLPSR